MFYDIAGKVVKVRIIKPLIYIVYHGQNTFYLLAFYKEVIKRQFIKLLKSAQAHIGIEILSLEKRLHKTSMDGIRVNVTESVFISG